MAASRSHAEIADDITRALKPFKRRGADLRREILLRIEIAERPFDVGAYYDKARDEAKRAEKALAILGDGFPEISALLKRAAGRKPWGMDRRFGVSQWLCALGAWSLIALFSKQPPVSAQGGNLHTIAQLIREAVTGTPGSSADTLRACKIVLREVRRAEQEHIPA
jgi:hypothetical protein